MSWKDHAGYMVSFSVFVIEMLTAILNRRLFLEVT